MNQHFVHWAKPIPLLFGLCIAWPLAAHATQTQLYVSPSEADGSGATCQLLDPCSLNDVKAKIQLMNASMTGDIIVNLMGGTYWLRSTFTLTERDSGTNGYDVIYRANPHDPAGAPVFSGGIEVTGSWENTPGSQIWSTNLGHSTSLVPLKFRQLYVNCVPNIKSCTRGTRARSPNALAATPYLTAIASKPKVQVHESDLPPYLTDWNGVEITWLAHYEQKRGRIDNVSISGTQATFTLKAQEEGDPYMYVINQDYDPSKPTRSSFTPYFFENHIRFLDAPGEWWLQQVYGTSALYLIPHAGHEPPNAKVIVPHLETLMKISGGSHSTLVRHIQVKGITFAHTNWTLPDDHGYLTKQAALHLHTTTPQTELPGALLVRNAEFVRIEGNTFQQTGAHGLLMSDKLRRNEVDGNKFTDLSAGGIVVFSDNNQDNVISNNLVEKAGQYYEDAVGILVIKPTRMSIEFNEVRDMPYTGISIGWEWHSAPSAFNDNVVRFNYIHGVMKLLDDGGGIYTLGNMSGTRFHHNHIQTTTPSPFIGKYPIAGIYLDNGSVGKTVEHNVIDGGNVDAFFAQSGASNGQILGHPANETTGGNVFTRNIYSGPKGTINNEGSGGSNNQFFNNRSISGTAFTNDAEVNSIVSVAGNIVNDATKTQPGVTHAIASSNSHLANFAADGLLDEQAWTPAAGDTAPWWQVNMLSAKRILKIQIVGKAGTDGATNRGNFAVWASETANMSGNNKVVLAASNQDGSGFPSESTWSYVLPAENAEKNKKFQYLAIVPAQPGSFHIREVRIFREK